MWSETKPMLRNEEEGSNSPTSFTKFISILGVLMAGFFFGLSLSSHFTQYSSSSLAELFFPRTVFYDMESFSFKGFIKPTHLMHSMSDDELFWRASMVPKIGRYPFDRVPKVAFLFLARGPLPFLPLWERFFRGHQGLYSIYVHTLPDYRIDTPKESVFFGRQIPSEEALWGSITLLDAEKRLLANALLDFSNERFVLLSESCIPVFNFPTVYKYLINSDHIFVESYDKDEPQGRGRYSRQMAPLIKRYQWRKGSEWFEINRKLAVSVVADYKYYNIFKKYCKPSCYPDEHYLPTFLNMFHGSLNANRSLTWVDWSRGGAHPATYGAPNITVEFIENIRNSNNTFCLYNSQQTSVCFLFARKFAPSALSLLLNLASTVMEF